jgi:predicted O-methyltransferase YrrM
LSTAAPHFWRRGALTSEDAAYLVRRGFVRARDLPGYQHQAGQPDTSIKQHTDSVDIVFLDADKQGYLDYLEKILPVVRPGGLIIAHNMRRPAPDPRYIEAITTNPDLDTSFLLMEGAGVGVTLKKR